jgi:hypothetical protein
MDSQFLKHGAELFKTAKGVAFGFHRIQSHILNNHLQKLQNIYNLLARPLQTSKRPNESADQVEMIDKMSKIRNLSCAFLIECKSDIFEHQFHSLLSGECPDFKAEFLEVEHLYEIVCDGNQLESS